MLGRLLGENNPVRVVEAFIDELDLAAAGFADVVPEATGRPAYHPATLLKIYLKPDRVEPAIGAENPAQHGTDIADRPADAGLQDFRKDNGSAIQATCRQLLCRKLDLFSDAIVAIDGSKFKAVNDRDKNYTPYKLQRRIEQAEASIARYLSAMGAADRQELAQAKSVRLKERIAALREQMQRFRAMEEVVRAAPDQQVSLTHADARSMATSG